MSRHSLDHDHSKGPSARTGQYARIEREDRPSAASKSLQRRSQEVTDAARVKEFVGIARRGEG